MKRPLCMTGIAFALAIWVAFFVGPNLALGLSLAAALSGLLLLLLAGRRFQVLVLAFFVTAAGLGAYCLYHARSVGPLERMRGETVLVEGIVTDVQAYGSSTRYLLAAHFPENARLPDTNLYLREYRTQQWVEGDILRMPVTLSPLPSSGSPGYYRSRGVWVMGEQAGEPLEPQTGRYGLRRFFIQLRAGLHRNVNGALPAESAGLVSAMILGIRDDIAPPDQTALTRSGTVHLLAISGLHFSVLSAFLLALCRRLRLPERLSGLLVLVGGLAFVFLVGASASIVRAFVMTAIMLLGRIISRQSDSLTSVGVALLVVGIVWPYWTHSSGIWLSAGATFGILLYGGGWSRALNARFGVEKKGLRTPVRALLSAVAISGSAYVFTFPVLLVQYGSLSVVAPLANALISPFVAPLVVGGLLCALLGPGSLVGRLIALLTHLCVQAVLGITHFFSRLPFATVSLDQGYLFLWMMGAVAVVILLRRFRADRHLAAYGVLLLLVSFGMGGLSVSAANRDRVELVTLENCGSALLLRGRQAVVLGTPSRYEVGTLINYMEYRGVREVALLVASDAGEQIDSGLLRFRDAWEIGAVLGPDDSYILEQLALAMEGVPVYASGYATVEALGGVRLAVHPANGAVAAQVGDLILLKTGEKYAIIEPYNRPEIRIDGEGQLLLPPGMAPLVEPAGAYLFGETRVSLPIH